MSDLQTLQNWMQAVIMHPDGPQSDEAVVEQQLTRSLRLTAAERLAIYHNAYHTRLLECLREEFPILQKALGEETFDAFAYGYLHACPSRSYTLTMLGERFAQFLADTCPEDVPPEWAALLIDLARLEWTFSDVFDGPGVEGQPLFDTAALAKIAAEEWLQSRLTPVPCLRLLQLRSPVHEYYTALRNGEELAPPPQRETFLAITRRDYVVRHLPLDSAEFALLSALAAGSSVIEALEQTAPLLQDEPDVAAALRGWFQRWTVNGFFAAAILSQGT